MVTQTTYVDGAWVKQDLPDLTSEEVAANLADFKERSKQRVKQSANERILQLISLEQQNNANARANELNKIRFERYLDGTPGVGVGADFWTDAERTEIATLESVFSWVKLVRAASNTIESQIDALTTSDALASYMETMETSELWP